MDRKRSVSTDYTYEKPPNFTNDVNDILQRRKGNYGMAGNEDDFNGILQ